MPRPYRRISRPLRILLGLTLCLTVMGALIEFTAGVRSFLRLQQDYALLGAASTGNADSVKVLLAEGANPNANRWDDRTEFPSTSALWWAVNSGNLPTVKLLLAHRANPNSRGQLPSVLDAALGHVDKADTQEKRREAMAILKALLAAGVDTHGITELKAVRLLKQAGAKE